MGVLGKTQIVVNVGTPGDGDSIAAYLADGSGNFLTSRVYATIRRLDVNTAADHAENGAHTLGDFGSYTLGVRNDTEGTIATANGNYGPLQLDSSGRLRVLSTLGAASDFTHLEDDAAVSGDRGAFVLGVRRDTTASLVSSSGDYSEFQTWSNGELKTVDIVNLANLQQVVTVGTTAAALPATALTNRKVLFVQNISALNVLYVGSATVTNSGATRGVRLGPGAFVEIDAGPADAVYGVGSAAGTDVVVWEHS